MSGLVDLPSGPFPVILADPPWHFATWSAKGRGRSPDGQGRDGGPRFYNTMTLEEIKGLDVARIAARDSVLFLWTTDPMLPVALDVGRAWGFTYQTVGFVWAKQTSTGRTWALGMGHWTRANPELCLLFTRGKPRRLSRAVRKLIIAPRREHSRKPDETHQRIEQLVAGPYVELFARASRPGWTTWGNQANHFDNHDNKDGS